MNCKCISRSISKWFIIGAVVASTAAFSFASETAGCAGGCCATPETKAEASKTLVAAAQGAHDHGAAGGAQSEAANSVGDPYTLSTCIVTGQKLGSMGKPVIHNHNGREIRFCCAGCVGPFEKNAEEYIQKIDKAIVDTQLKSYPLETCVATGGKLGSMGEPVNYVHNNRLVRFCCAGCINSFKADPAKFTAKIDQAVIEKQTASYPLDTCVVMGSKLGTMGKPVDVVVGNQLVRLCCAGCKDKVMAEPAKYLDQINQAAEQKK